MQQSFLSLLRCPLITQPRLSHAAAETQEPARLNTIQSLRLMMNFLTLCCNASLRLRSEASVSALLSTAASCTSQFDCSQLICHILTIFSTTGNCRKSDMSGTQNIFPRVKVDEIPWEIALSLPRSDLVVACEHTYLGPGNWSSRMVQRASHLVY